MISEPCKVLVAEPIADAGVALLRERFEVDLGTGWSREELAARIGDYHGIVIRSATHLDAELIGRAGRLRVIGRAGIGVDNVDLAAATKRGIVVANAPQSNVVAAAEHTLALMLGARAQRSAGACVAGRRALGALAVRWRRGVREDARRARLRAHRAAGCGARAGVRDAGGRVRSVRLGGALPRARRRASRDARRPVCGRRTSSRCICPGRRTRVAGSMRRRSR